jgi:putative transposase
MLTAVHDTESANENDGGAGRSLLDEIVRDGARQMLAAALQAEVAAYVEQFVDHLDEDGRRLVVRNGYHHEREVLTAAGAVKVTHRGSTTAGWMPIPVNGSGFPRRSCRPGRVSGRR